MKKQKNNGTLSMGPKSNCLAVATMALGLSLVMTAPALGASWIGGTDLLWETGANWTGGVAPGGGGTAIENGDSVLLDWTTTAFTSDLDLNGGSTLTIRSNLMVGGDFDFQGAAHVVIESGTVTAGDDLKMDNDGALTFKMMGGSFETGVSGEDGYFNLTDSASRLEISGGTFSIEDYVTISGTLQIIGDGATEINFGTNGEPVTLENIFEVVMKGGGISTIDVFGNVALSGVLDVTLDGGFVLPGIDTDYNLIVAGSQSGAFTTVNLPSGDWSVAAQGSNLVLSYTALPVPEPGTMTLLAIGGLGLLLMRRRRRS